MSKFGVNPIIQKLIAELKSTPLVTICGLTDGTGAGGSWIEGGPKRAMSFGVTFAAWRIGNGPIEKSPIYVRHYAPESKWDEFSRLVEPYSILKTKGHVLKSTVLGSAQALAIEMLKPATDKELTEVIEDLRKPVFHRDPIFGKMQFDRAMAWFDGKAKWLRKPVRVVFCAPTTKKLTKPTTTAHALWKQQTNWNKKSLDLIVSEYLDLYNKTWRFDDAPVLTAAKFRRRFALETIQVESNGNIALWFNDDNLFGGHSIEVTGTLKKGPTQAGLQG